MWLLVVLGLDFGWAADYIERSANSNPRSSNYSTPYNNYSPFETKCPTANLIRNADSVCCSQYCNPLLILTTAVVPIGNQLYSQ